MIYTFSYVLLRSPIASIAAAYDETQKMPGLFDEGLYLSSPTLHTERQRLDALSPKDREKADLAVAKYRIRASSRCTPFATLAGSLLVPITDGASGIVLGEPEQHVKRLRVDMNYLSGIIAALVKDPGLRTRMQFFVNNSLYETPDAFRYAEYVLRDDVRNYDLTSVESALYLRSVLERAATGATMHTLSALLEASEGVSPEEALAFIASLIDAQILVSELEPCITGADPLERLVEQLRPWPEAATPLRGLEDSLRLIRAAGRYQAIEQALASAAGPSASTKNALQVDLYLHASERHISEASIRTVVDQVEELHALGRPLTGGELEDFARKFTQRFDQAEVPLAIALDAELGIPYGNGGQPAAGGEWVDALTLDGAAEDQRFIFDYIQQFVLRKYDDYLRRQQAHITISEDELKTLRSKMTGLVFPTSLYVMGSLLGEGDRLLFDLTGVGGPSAGNLLGRFTHGDPAIRDFTTALLRQEEEAHPEALFAEIVHLPQARTGNVLLRPLLRTYEIPYVGLSGAAPDHQLPLEDLLVYVRHGEVILRSKKHDRRVLPRLTTAHNYLHQSLPVYRLLCDLQNQGLAQPCVWDWGSLSSLARLPRVVYKNIVLQKARWTVEEKEGKDLPLLLRTSGLPQQVVYADQDNKLLIDFAQPVGAALFHHYLKRKGTLVLEEFLPTKEHCIVRDAAGAPFLNEVIIPLRRERGAPAPPLARAGSLSHAGNPPGAGMAPDAGIAARRTFSPYSEWLYCKVYCGPKTAEHLLKTVIRDFVDEGIGSALFERFFFIRYKDDAHHLRVRFYNADLDKQLAVYKAFLQTLQPFIDTGLVARVAVDTYEREIERYGADMIDAAETLFFHDSIAVLRFIRLLEGEDMEQYRLLFALRGIDTLMDDFGFSPEDKAAFSKQLQAQFFTEFGGKLSLQRQLNEQYRKYQKAIFSHMDPANDPANGIEEGVGIFQERSAGNARVLASFPGALPAGFPEGQVHMFMNRLFPARQRTHELVVYHFLDKYYASRRAMGSHKM